MTDNREPWQIAVSIRMQTAAAYLALLEKTPSEQDAYARAFNADKEFEQWISEKVKGIIRSTNSKVAGRGCVVRFVEPRFVAQLHALGLAENVQSAGGIRID